MSEVLFFSSAGASTATFGSVLQVELRINRELAPYVQRFFESLSERRQRVATWRAEANKPHTLKVGDIITNSWGYDQTNVDWYRITRTTEHFVRLDLHGSIIPHLDHAEVFYACYRKRDTNLLHQPVFDC